MGGNRKRRVMGDDPVPEKYTDKAFARVGVLLVYIVYIPYFFLPAFNFNNMSPVPGWEALLACFIFPLPPFLLVIVGHIAFWTGSVSLLMGHWWTSFIAAILALGSSLFAVVLIGNPLIGVIAKLLSMALLTVFAFIAVRCAKDREGRTS
jgi:hypothetical protein